MIWLILVALLVLLVIAAYLTNPFNRFTVIRRPFIVQLRQDALHAIDNNQRLRVRQTVGWKWFAVAKRGVHVLSSRYMRSPRSKGTTIQAIIDDIHKLRFDPSKLLLISGDHFSDLFVRNLGVFYYPMLDTAIAGSKQDWRNRQTVYLQTVAYALGVFTKHRVPTTTIVSTGPYQATCINLYAYPSDTVYALLYALATLQGKESAQPYRYSASTHHHLATFLAAKALTREYRNTLRDLYTHYRQTVFDEATGLIRMDLHLSGAKDITRRRCAFYDNVIFWKTTELAGRLGLTTPNEPFLHALKQRILDTFWIEADGHFLEDLSAEGKQKRYYSSEWLIVLVTGFLDPTKPAERLYYERSVAYIQAHKVDKPFALKYHHDTRAHRQFWLVRLAVASYGGDAIWSFWGMEYIKVLLILYTSTKRRSYLDTADYHINAYTQAMLREGGFPEVYDAEGNFLETPFYRSIRQTSWVIGFEQVLAIRAALLG